MWFSLSVHLDRTGEREAHQLAGTQSCSICIVRVSKSWRSGAIPYIQYDSNRFHKETGGTCSLALCKESHQLWQEAIDRNITILSPQRLALKVNTEADFLSRHSLRRWDFKLISLDFRRVCCKLQVWPNFDAFASDGAHQVDRYMTLDIDPNAVATNALDYY